MHSSGKHTYESALIRETIIEKKMSTHGSVVFYIYTDYAC